MRVNVLWCSNENIKIVEKIKIAGKLNLNFRNKIMHALYIVQHDNL